MRRIGTLKTEQEAHRFSDYLYTLEIENQVSGRDGTWEIWSLDEDRLEQARDELASFCASPGDAKYAAAAGAAQAQRDARLQAMVTARKQQIDLRERWERPAWRQTPVTFMLAGLCLLVTIVTGFGEKQEETAALQVETRIITKEVNNQYSYQPPAVPLQEIRRGEVWRLVTPIFIHMDPMHLIGNLMLGVLLGGMIERERGSWRLLIGVLLVAAASNLAQYAADGPRFGGLSGVVYGMFGYVWLMGRLAPESGLQISRETSMIMVVWLVVCWFGVVGPVANMCHAVGLAMGLVLAGAEIVVRRAWS